MLEAGDGPPLLFLHGAGGVPAWEGVLPLLARAFHVYAPLLPGFGQSTGLEYLEDQLDLILHGFDVLEALGLERPVRRRRIDGRLDRGRDGGAPPEEIGRLALAAPLGLWRDEAPVADMFGAMTHELVPLSLPRPAPSRGAAHARRDRPSSARRTTAREEQVEFLIVLARGFRTAAKFLFPIPEHGLEKRLARITAPTLVVWGAQDRFVQPLYGKIFAAKIPNARLETIDRAGHLVGLERPEPYAQAVVRWGHADG